MLSVCVVTQDAEAVEGCVDHTVGFNHGQRFWQSIGGWCCSHQGPFRPVPLVDSLPVGTENGSCVRTDESVEGTGSQAGGEHSVVQIKRLEGPVAQQKVKDVVGGINRHVRHAAVSGKIAHVHHHGVVVGVEHHQLVVHRDVQVTSDGVGDGRTDVEINRRERHHGVGRGKGFNDHVGDDSVGGQVPTRVGVAVRCQATAVGWPVGEPIGHAEGAQSPPVKQGCIQAVNRQEWFGDRKAVLRVGSHLQRYVGQHGAWSEHEVPICRGLLTEGVVSAQGIQSDPSSVVAALQRP